MLTGILVIIPTPTGAVTSSRALRSAAGLKA